jgi:hypothetical protein
VFVFQGGVELIVMILTANVKMVEIASDLEFVIALILDTLDQLVKIQFVYRIVFMESVPRLVVAPVILVIKDAFVMNSYVQIANMVLVLVLKFVHVPMDGMEHHVIFQFVNLNVFMVIVLHLTRVIVILISLDLYVIFTHVTE